MAEFAYSSFRLPTVLYSQIDFGPPLFQRLHFFQKLQIAWHPLKEELYSAKHPRNILPNCHCQEPLPTPFFAVRDLCL